MRCAKSSNHVKDPVYQDRPMPIRTVLHECKENCDSDQGKAFFWASLKAEAQPFRSRINHWKWNWILGQTSQQYLNLCSHCWLQIKTAEQGKYWWAREISALSLWHCTFHPLPARRRHVTSLTASLENCRLHPSALIIILGDFNHVTMKKGLTNNTPALPSHSSATRGNHPLALPTRL